MTADKPAFDWHPSDADARREPARQCCSACGSVRLPRAAYCVECGGCLLGMSHAQWLAAASKGPTSGDAGFVYDEDDDHEIELGLHDLEVISFDFQPVWLRAS